jgi:hypothetical protein
MVKRSFNYGDCTKAIVIRNVKDDLECIRAEYDHVSKELGRRGIDWKVEAQYASRDDGKMYDNLVARVISTGKIRNFVFDITIRFKGLL